MSAPGEKPGDSASQNYYFIQLSGEEGGTNSSLLAYVLENSVGGIACYIPLRKGKEVT